ncbi:MAG TPA: hypothetical protein VFH73_23260 [Polyangia bacterium]|nr:hypothetical protein [Polyangia bacterium]
MNPRCLLCTFPTPPTDRLVLVNGVAHAACVMAASVRAKEVRCGK